MPQKLDSDVEKGIIEKVAMVLGDVICAETREKGLVCGGLGPA